MTNREQDPEACPSPSEADVVPDLAMQILFLLWIVLIGGRWIATPFLMFSSIMTQSDITRMDRGPLLICYLLLVVATLTMLALRFARSMESRTSANARKARD